MQTFLPYEYFEASAKVLDPSRLGNQFYREGLTLLRGGWLNHPASKMWTNHKYWLGLYLLACYRELKSRGRDYEKHALEVIATMAIQPHRDKPIWLGNEDFHASHRSNLLRKDPVHYGQFGWSEPDDLPYIWPV